LFFIILKKSTPKHVYLLLAFTPLINIGLLPGIVGGLTLILAIEFLKTKQLLPLLKNILPLTLVIFFVLIYYKINGGYDIEKQTSINTLSSGLNLKGELIKIVFKLSYAFCWLAIIYGVYLIVAIKNKSIIRENKKIISFTLACLLAGISTRPIIEGFNAAQFLTYLLPLLNVCIIILLIQTMESKSKWGTSGIITLIVIIACINGTKTYFNCTTRREINIDKLQGNIFTQKAINILSSYKQPKIAYLLNDNDVKNIQPGYWYGYYPCEFLLTQDYFNLYSLNYPYQKYPKNSLSSRYTNWNHQIYLLKNKVLNARQFETHILNFITNYQIQIIILKSHATLPIGIKQKIKTQIKDPISGDQLLILK
jgi:hypothetical protein